MVYTVDLSALYFYGIRTLSKCLDEALGVANAPFTLIDPYFLLLRSLNSS